MCCTVNGGKWRLPLEITLYIAGVCLNLVAGDMSVTINKDTSVLEDYVMIRKPPEVLANRKLKVEYRCTDHRIVGLEIISNVDNKASVKIFRKQWNCAKSDDQDSSTRTRTVKIKMSPSIAYNYDVFNKEIQMTSLTKIRVWIIDRIWWPTCFQQNNCFSRSKVRATYETTVSSPFSRPFYRKSLPCRKWSMDVLSYVSSLCIPQCPLEEETVEMIQYPVVLGGRPYGVFRQLNSYRNKDVEDKRIAQMHKPRLTVSVWMFILEYCPRHTGTCSVFQHITRDGEYRTLLFFLRPDGKCHIQVTHADGQTSAAITHFILPIHQWIRVVLSFNVNTWDLTVNSGPEFNKTIHTSYRHHGAPVVLDDTEGLIVFGGFETQPSFRGYIGQSTWYRNRALQAKEIPFPSPFHPMFELKLSRREERCEHYIDWVTTRIRVHRDRLQKAILKDSCQPYFPALMREVMSRGSGSGHVCAARAGRHGRQWRAVDRTVRRMVWASADPDFRSIADSLYDTATTQLDEGLEAVPGAFHLLKQAACYGNDDAMYAVAVILNNGIHVKADEIQSQAYLMMAALENHRLSCMALGHKHRYGIDGVPLDLEQSYMYYKYVADTTLADKELHKHTDVLTESIRLSDEDAIRQQTDENGDIFHWLTHQAKQGVLSAQNKVGRALFWGSQGLKRNTEAAVEYFKMSADTGDSQSQYDYGIALLRGQGIEQDKDAGLKQLQKSAEQNNPYAINAIGWYAKNHEDDLQKAADYFTRAYKMGNAEAGYNLGVMYLYGQVPGQKKDADKALSYFKYAGTRGHVDAGIGIAYLTIKGTPNHPSDVITAVEWARFIAEKNPAIGNVLRKGIQLYRKGQKDVSLFYYMLAADAGVEVGSFNVAWGPFYQQDVSLFYYMLAADTGVEVGSFNVAWLCEENQDGVVSFIEKNCVWRLFNMSVQREIQFVDPYALIKMGDYYWYGCGEQKNETLAVSYYSAAINKGDPHALFNLGFMVEEGVRVPRSVLSSIRVPEQSQTNRVALLEHLYTRCQRSRKSEAYIPCSIALWKVQILTFWARHQTVIQISSFTGIAAMTTLSLIIILRTHLRPREPDTTI